MAEIYRMYTETHYDAMTKATGSNQAQAWDGASMLGGAAGDIKMTLTGGGLTAPVYAGKTGLDLTGKTSMAIRCYFDTTTLTQASGETMSFLSLIQSAAVLGFGLSTSGAQARINFFVVQDSGAQAQNVINYTKGVHYIDIVVIKATTDSANDGSITYYLDGVQVAQRTGLDLFDRFAGLTSLQFGAGSTFSPPDAGTSGNFWLGKLLITDGSTAIGAYSQHNQLLFNQLRRKRRLS